MESGNKKYKRRYVIIGIMIAIVVFIIAILGMMQKEHISMDSTNVSFFKHLLSRTEKGDIRVITLDLYLKDGHHYYDVVFEEYDYDIEAMNEFQLVYYGNFESINGYFCPNWEDKGDLLDKYNAYLDAKENGEHYSFSLDEIEDYMDEYYASK